MTSLSTYDFSTLNTTLPHNLIKEKPLYFIEPAYKKFYKNEGTLYLAACNDKIAFFTSTDHRGYKLGLVRIYVTPNRSFWIKLTSDLVIRYTLSEIVGNPIGADCAPLVADLFLFCYERDFMTSLSDDNHLTQPLDIWTIFLILKILISKEWSIKFILLSCN